MYTIMGATGHTGGAAARELLARSEPVRALSRGRERLEPLVAQGAEPAVGDPWDEEFLREAFTGSTAVYAMMPSDPAAVDLRADYNRYGRAIAGALETAGVERVVLLSSVGAELAEGTGPIVGLHDVEEILGELGAQLCILRPGYFYENLYAALGLIREQGINGSATDPDVSIPMVATRDIGIAAAEELTGTGPPGPDVRELVGPRDYTMAEVTAILGEAIGKPDLPYVRFPDEDFHQALLAMGFSVDVADRYLEMERAFNAGRVRTHQGRNERTTCDTSFEAFARELAEAYRQQA